MSRTDYILRSLAKISKKRWEHYAINRIYHRLDDLTIEFVCQQCIRKNDKEFYLADLFFPQLKLYVEIDEGHHETDQNKIRDAKRRLDIAEATGLKEVRIPACGVTIWELNASIDDFVELVRQRKANAVLNDEFHDWNYQRRFTSAPHLEAGYIEIGPQSAFRTHRDGLNCFGYSKGNYQKAVWNVPEKVAEAVGLSGSCVVWFPHLYHHDQWDNSVSDNGLVITEINKNLEHVYRESCDKRIVMARSRDELNRILYRFVGVFEIIPEYRDGNEHRFRRVASRVETYRSDKL